MAQIWFFVIGLAVMTAGVLVVLVADRQGRAAPARFGLGVTVLGLAIGVAGAFVG